LPLLKFQPSYNDRILYLRRNVASLLPPRPGFDLKAVFID